MAFRFWCNDDDDQIAAGGEDDVIPPGQPDSQDDQIDCRRDLEDFARLAINIGGLQEAIANGTIQVGLEWRNITPTEGSSPSIKVYQAAEPDGGEEYVKNTDGAQTWATKQVSPRYRPKLSTTVAANDTLFRFPTWFWDSTPEGLAKFDADHANRYLLFEGVTKGKGQLVLTFWKGTTPIGEGGGCWLDIKDIKTMYARVNGTTSSSPPWSQNPYAGVQTQNSSFDSIQFEKPSDEQDKAIVFVHGIHSPGLVDPAAIKADWYSTCETTFKRLWWQGYKGRFAAYKWSALTPGGLWPNDFRFNDSEYRAWNFGDGLSQFVNSIQRSHKTIIAHSQGNAVVGAALRSGSLTVENYIMMQAAVPGGCYDTQNGTVNGYQRFMDAEVNSPTPDSTNDLGYRGYLSSLGVTGRVVNFQNGIDYAFVTGTSFGLESNWEKCEVDYKPNVPVPYGWSTDGYLYNNQKAIGHRGELHKFSAFAREVSDIREPLSFVARPRSKAAGALGATRGSIQSDTSLRGIPYNFTDDPKEHGGQWSRPIQKAWDVYSSWLDVINGE